MSLPVCHGGLAIPQLASIVVDEHKASLVITQPLVDLVVSDQPLSNQDVVLIHAVLVTSHQASVDVRTDRRSTLHETVKTLTAQLPPCQQFLMSMADEKVCHRG